MEIVYWILDKVVWALGAMSIGQWVGVGLIIVSHFLYDYYFYHHIIRRTTTGGVIELPKGGYKGLWSFRLEGIIAYIVGSIIGLVSTYLIMAPIWRALKLWPFN